MRFVITERIAGMLDDLLTGDRRGQLDVDRPPGTVFGDGRRRRRAKDQEQREEDQDDKKKQQDLLAGFLFLCS